MTKWVEPSSSTQNGLAMLLPNSNHTEDGKITCNLDLWFYTASQNAESIAVTQIAIMEKIFNAVYGKGRPPLPILKAVILETEYEHSLPPYENMGRARALIELVLAFNDDDDGSN